MNLLTRRPSSDIRLAQTLLALPPGPHGSYEFGKAAKVRTGRLYRLLHLWLEQGWLADSWESQPVGRPPRRLYELTELGREELQRMVERESRV